jgi:hypothetical protein
MRTAQRNDLDGKYISAAVRGPRCRPPLSIPGVTGSTSPPSMVSTDTQDNLIIHVVLTPRVSTRWSKVIQITLLGVMPAPISHPA